MTDWLNQTHVGDCRELLPRMAADGVRVQTCVTSPPYFGLRDYGVAGQIGLEPTLEIYVSRMVKVFALVRDLLTDDGTLWLNLGDAYAGSWKGQSHTGYTISNLSATQLRASPKGSNMGSLSKTAGLKSKDLMGIPWRVAFALQADGWYLRSDIIEEVELYCPCGCGYVLEERIWRWSQDRELVWHKPNPMPESVRDRPTKAHEYLFLFSKAQRYYFDADAIKEPAEYGVPNSPQSIASPYGQGFTRRARSVDLGEIARRSEAVPCIGASRKDLRSDIESRHRASIEGGQSLQAQPNGMRNKRSVWTVATSPYGGAHFATWPRKLIEPCIVAGSRPGDVVLDPFMGSGTTRQVATDLGRSSIGCEMNPAYIELDRLRRTTIGMPF
jgi:DNA modification methylase